MNQTRNEISGENAIKYILIATIFLFVGAALRWHDIDMIGLWSDELFTVSAALDVGEGKSWLAYVSKVIPELKINDSFLTWKAADNTPPLYELLLIVWAKVFGSSDFALRSLSAAIGSLVPAVFYFGLRRPLGNRAALLGMIILCLSPAALAYSQEVRAYILTMLLSTAAVVLLINRVLDTNADTLVHDKKLPPFWVDIVVYIFLSYSHYTGLFTYGLLSVIYFFLVIVPQKRYSHVFKLLLVPVAIAPWFYLSWKAFKFTSHGGLAWGTYHFSDIASMMIPKTIDFFLMGAGSVMVLMWLVALLGALTGRDQAGKWFFSMQTIQEKLCDKKMLLALAFILVVLMQFLYSVYNAFSSKMWHPRYFSASVPIVIASLSLLFSTLKNWKGIAFFATAAISCFSLMTVSKYFHDRPNSGEGYREASHYIAENVHPDAKIVLGWEANAAFYSHYLKPQLLAKNYAVDMLAVSMPNDVADFCSKLSNATQQVILFQHEAQSYINQMNSCSQVKLNSDMKFRGVVVAIYSRSAN